MLKPSVPISHSFRTGLSRIPLPRALSPGSRIALRPLSSTLLKSPRQSPHLPDFPHQDGDDLKTLAWTEAEEDLTSTADQGDGFYPLRLGETLDDGRFVITRKLGWGRCSSVWLAGDRK